MKKRRTIFALLLAMALCLGTLAACSGGSQGSSQAGSGSAPASTGGGGGDEVTLTYWNLTATDMPFEADLIAEFESQNPGIKIQLEQVPVENFHDKLIMAAETNTLPDVTQCIPEWSSDMVQAGAIQDISADIDDVKDTYIEDGLALAIWDGKNYGLPFRFGTSCTFINTAIFEAANVEIPEEWTWDEFYEVAKSVTNADDGVYGFGIPGAKNDLGFSWNYLSFAFQNGGTYMEDGKATFNSAESAEALDFLKGMMDDGIMPESTASFTAKDVVDAFGSGKLAMFHNGPWYVATVKASYPDMDFVTVPLPTKKPAAEISAASVAGGTYVSVCEGTENYEAALTFIKHLTSADNMREWAGQGEFLPPVKELLNDDSFIQGPMVAFAAQAQQPSIVIGATPENTTLLEIMQDEMGQALTGAKTSQEALDAAAAEWDAILANY